MSEPQSLNTASGTLLTSIAPTGTISLFADNVSSGIEPVFGFSFTRHVLMPDGTRRDEEVTDYAHRLFRKLKGENTPLPDAFVDAQSLSPKDHLVMQAAMQKFIDSSISKTINCPENIQFEEFKDVYMQAYDLGCKGCTTYRPNDVTGAVLETNPSGGSAPSTGQRGTTFVTAAGRQCEAKRPRRRRQPSLPNPTSRQTGLTSGSNL